MKNAAGYGIALIMKGVRNAPGTLIVILNLSDYCISPLHIMIDLPMDKHGNELESPRGKIPYLQPRGP